MRGDMIIMIIILFQRDICGFTGGYKGDTYPLRQDNWSTTTEQDLVANYWKRTPQNNISEPHFRPNRQPLESSTWNRGWGGAPAPNQKWPEKGFLPWLIEKFCPSIHLSFCFHPREQRRLPLSFFSLNSPSFLFLLPLPFLLIDRSVSHWQRQYTSVFHSLSQGAFQFPNF